MLSTTALRREWGPQCFPSSRAVRIDLHGEGRIYVRPEVVPAFRALDAVLVRHGYRTRRADTGALVCRRITGGTGVSLHGLGIAVDLNWLTNPYGRRLVTDMSPAMVADIKRIVTVDGVRVFGWGGDYRSVKDAMHWEIVCTRAQLARGIRGQAGPAKPTPPAPPEEPFTVAQYDNLIKRLDAIEAKLDRVSAQSDTVRGDVWAVLAALTPIRQTVDAINTRVASMHQGRYGETDGYSGGDLGWLDDRLRWSELRVTKAVTDAVRGLKPKV